MTESLTRAILIVEDSLEVGELLVMTLEPLGIRLVHVLDGAEALALLKTETFDAVLTDFHMPNMNGIQLIEAMKHDQLDTPVVMVTGYADTELMLHALRLGAADFLQKPFVEAEAREVMSRVVEIGFRRRRIKTTLSSAKAGEKTLAQENTVNVARDERMIALLQLVNRQRSS